MVAPGDYKVRLSVGSFSEERPLQVLSDPRLARDGVTDAMIGEQTRLLLDIRERITDARGVLQKLTQARARIQSDATPLGLARLKGLDAVIARIQTAGGAYPQPMLIDQFAAVLNPPEGAILAVGRSRKVADVHGDGLGNSGRVAV